MDKLIDAIDELINYIANPEHGQDRAIQALVALRSELIAKELEKD